MGTDMTETTQGTDLLKAAGLQRKFEEGEAFDAFVARASGEHNTSAWLQRYELLELSDEQRALVEGFGREMRILCVTGPWCGDCALQGAALARIAEANPERVGLRFLNRNEHAELIVKMPICGGFRVPVTIFCAEDFEIVSRFGDRTLSRYRAIARKALGPEANVVAPAPQDPVREVLREMLDEVERVQLVLRLSTRLREKHGD